ncbi:MAG TPA: ribonuclease R, partial [Acetobacteraceae bacterium]|nr:ribonuclease R [Acetobacteraceae bacterium]
MRPPRAARATALPSRDEVRRFIAGQTGRVGKREIARAFRLGPEHSVGLRALLKELQAEGATEPGGAKRFRPAGRLPEAAIVQITGTDPDGDALARPVGWQGDGPPPLVLMAPERRGQTALAPGQRVLARLRPIGPGRYEGRTVKRLTEEPGR